MEMNHPVIIGVGEAKNPSTKCEDAIEPLDLMVQALNNAFHDADTPDCVATRLIKDIDSLSVVASSTWPYDDLPTQVSRKLGVNPKYKVYSGLTGNSSVELLDDTAQRIARGEADVGVIVGGEAFGSLKQFIKNGKYPPPWTPPRSGTDTVYYANDIDLLNGLARAYRIGVPMQVYPLYENGLRAHLGQTIEENHCQSAKMYGNYASVAANNPIAWNYGKEPHTKASIGTITARNRMICFPYPLLMNAFNDVNLAGACIVTSRRYAERAGIPKEKCIYPLGGGRGEDADEFWKRPDFYSSPALQRALDMALKSSRLQKSDIDIFDFYSCFPIVPKLACRHLGIDFLNSSKPITLLGGLTSFGGAGANYSMHAIAEMVRQLRQRGRTQRTNGLVLANGGTLTHENAVCLSNTPLEPHRAYPQYQVDVKGNKLDGVPAICLTPQGEARVETYTVEYDRQNEPKLGHVVCRLLNSNHRVIANHADDMTLQQLASRTEEPIGRLGYVEMSKFVPGQNLFSFVRKHKL